VNSSGTAAGFGLVSAASWGGSDFIGGVGARRAPALLVVASGHIFSLFVLLVLCRTMQVALPGSASLFYAALGGFEGSLALAIFYRALAMGAMGLTAALTGLLTALVPVLFSLIHEGLPSPLTVVGLIMGLAAIWLITHTPATKGPESRGANLLESHPEDPMSHPQIPVPHPFRALCEMGGKPRPSTIPVPATALLLGALAGLGFGTQLILFKMATIGGILWAMTSARAAGVVALLIVLAVNPPKGPWRGFWLTGTAAGALDTLGNLFYIQASRVGRLDVAALVCSMYPAGTILLAALVLREWPTRRQFAGMALALAAVALLSV
jgi:drug/metabolite transporter (DMT)-like permease